MKEYNVTREIAVLPLAFYTLGFAVGPLFTAPMSELYGRRIVYWSTMFSLLIFTAISGAANSVTLLTVMRLLAGFFGSGSLAVGAGTNFFRFLEYNANSSPGTVSDLWNHQARGKAALSFILAPFLGPALGPLTGAYIISEYHNSWR
jgi:MFS family permease